MSSPSTDQDLRRLGAFERTIDLYTHRNPVQFSIALQLGRDVTEDDLRRALRHLQRVHPLLAVEIVHGDPAGDPERDAVFRRTDNPIPLRCASRSTWPEEAAAEQATAIPPTPGPLVRSVLLPAEGPDGDATVVMTFAHQIADGRGALQAVRDLTAILDGSVLPAGVVPRSQEDLLPQEVSSAVVASADSGEQTPAQDPTPLGTLRTFDGELPSLQVAELTADETSALVARARDESCTVQGALCAAAATALFDRTGRSRITINVPVDLRSELASSSEVAIRFSGATVILDSTDRSSFWSLARRAGAQLEEARRPESLRAAVRGLAGMAPRTPEAAETAMLAATAADIEITNLGIADFESSTVRGVWGPTMTTQVDGEQILGVVTHGGVLRMVNTTREPFDDLMRDLVALLRTESRN